MFIMSRFVGNISVAHLVEQGFSLSFNNDGIQILRNNCLITSTIIINNLLYLNLMFQ